VDRKFVAGCGDNRLKQVVCRRILELVLLSQKATCDSI
jgi:hypothetical protein